MKGAVIINEPYHRFLNFFHNKNLVSQSLLAPQLLQASIRIFILIRDIAKCLKSSQSSISRQPTYNLPTKAIHNFDSDSCLYRSNSQQMMKILLIMINIIQPGVICAPPTKQDKPDQDEEDGARGGEDRSSSRVRLADQSIDTAQASQQSQVSQNDNSNTQTKKDQQIGLTKPDDPDYQPPWRGRKWRFQTQKQLLIYLQTVKPIKSARKQKDQRSYVHPQALQEIKSIETPKHVDITDHVIVRNIVKPEEVQGRFKKVKTVSGFIELWSSLRMNLIQTRKEYHSKNYEEEIQKQLDLFFAKLEGALETMWARRKSILKLGEMPSLSDEFYLSKKSKAQGEESQTTSKSNRKLKITKKKPKKQRFDKVYESRKQYFTRKLSQYGSMWETYQKQYSQQLEKQLLKKATIKRDNVHSLNEVAKQFIDIQSKLGQIDDKQQNKDQKSQLIIKRNALLEDWNNKKSKMQSQIKEVQQQISWAKHILRNMRIQVNKQTSYTLSIKQSEQALKAYEKGQYWQRYMPWLWQIAWRKIQRRKRKKRQRKQRRQRFLKGKSQQQVPPSQQATEGAQEQALVDLTLALAREQPSSSASSQTSESNDSQSGSSSSSQPRSSSSSSISTDSTQTTSPESTLSSSRESLLEQSQQYYVHREAYKEKMRQFKSTYDVSSSRSHALQHRGLSPDLLHPQLRRSNSLPSHPLQTLRPRPKVYRRSSSLPNFNIGGHK